MYRSLEVSPSRSLWDKALDDPEAWKQFPVLFPVCFQFVSRVGIKVKLMQSSSPPSESPVVLTLAVEEWLPVGGEEIENGGVVVSSPEKLSGFLRFRHEEGAATSVQDAPVADAFMMPVSSRVDRVGLAVYNAGGEELTVVLRVGNRVLYKTIPAQAKTASFVDELFPGHRLSRDALTVRTDPPGGQITVLALEMVGGSLVTIPAVVLD